MLGVLIPFVLNILKEYMESINRKVECWMLRHVGLRVLNAHFSFSLPFSIVFDILSLFMCIVHVHCSQLVGIFNSSFLSSLLQPIKSKFFYALLNPRHSWNLTLLSKVLNSKSTNSPNPRSTILQARVNWFLKSILRHTYNTCKM